MIKTRNILAIILVCLLWILSILAISFTDNSTEDTGIFAGVYNDDDWGRDIEIENETPPYEGFSVSKELALDIANSVFKSMYGDSFIDETVFNVREIGGKNFYIVTRYYKKKNLLGPDYNIAISKINGKILKIGMVE